MIELLTKNKDSNGWVDQVPGPISSGYQAQNTVLQVSWLGRDDSYIVVNDGNSVMVKVSGIIDDFGLPFVVKQDLRVGIPSSYGNYFLYLYPLGDLSRREIRTTLSSPTWLPAQNCYGVTDGRRICRVLNWIVRRDSKGLSAVRFRQIDEARPVEWIFFQNVTWRCPKTGKYALTAVSSHGYGGGGGGGGKDGWEERGSGSSRYGAKSGGRGGDGGNMFYNQTERQYTAGTLVKISVGVSHASNAGGAGGGGKTPFQACEAGRPGSNGWGGAGGSAGSGSGGRGRDGEPSYIDKFSSNDGTVIRGSRGLDGRGSRVRSSHTHHERDDGETTYTTRVSSDGGNGGRGGDGAVAPEFSVGPNSSGNCRIKSV